MSYFTDNNGGKRETVSFNFTHKNCCGGTRVIEIMLRKMLCHLNFHKTMKIVFSQHRSDNTLLKLFNHSLTNQFTMIEQRQEKISHIFSFWRTIFPWCRIKNPKAQLRLVQRTNLLFLHSMGLDIRLVVK